MQTTVKKTPTLKAIAMMALTGGAALLLSGHLDRADALSANLSAPITATTSDSLVSPVGNFIRCPGSRWNGGRPAVCRDHRVRARR